MTTLLHAPPSQLPAGDTIEYLQLVPSDYEAWTPSARLTGPSTMDATSCVLEGSDFHIKFEGQATAGTKDLEPGQYTLSVFATNGNDRKTIATHYLTVLPDAQLVTDGRTFEARMVEILEAAIEARVSGNSDGGIENYIIDGVSITKLPTQELERMLARYRNALANQQSRGALGSVKFAFTPTGGMVAPRARYPWRGSL